jgi:uncharacterized membrane protein (DUF2068 family)
MRRSSLIVGVTIVELLLALLLVGISIFLVVWMRSPEVQQSSNAADEIFGLKMAAGVLVIPGVSMLLAALGLWKDKLWGWWLALLVDLAIAVTLIYGVIDDGWRVADSEDISLAVISVVPIVLLLIPAVRKHYWQGSDSSLPVR